MNFYSNFVVMFSHTNYKKNNNGGTEKFIRNIQELYNKDYISVICFFPIKRLKNFVGILVDGKYFGVEKIKNIPKLIKQFESIVNNKCLGIIIQHLKGYDISSVEKVFKILDYKIILAIHDFYFICNTFNFLKNKDTFCGLDMPSEEKCKNCHNYNSIKTFSKNRDKFFNTIDSKVDKIIFPSEFCEKKWIEAFPQYENRAIIRHHLEYYGVYDKKKNNKRIKIAYIGRKSKTKGIETWRKLCSINTYEFYYFGIDIDNNNENEIFVSSLIDNNMTNKLREYNIDIVVLWSIIPETYSFTYYEASSAGCYVITNKNSGNICEQIKNNNNGKIYESEEELLNDFKSKNIEKSFYEFSNNNQKFSPLYIKKNENLEYYKLNKTTQINKKIKIKRKISFFSILYYFKNERTG